MSDLQDLLRRVERLEARAEIGELASAYAVACDEHDMDRLMSLFTDDAVFDSPNGTMRANGIKEIEAMFIRMFKIRGPAYHWTHDHFIRFDTGNPDQASGTLLSHAETSPNNEVSLAAMRYQDEYRRDAGQWKFQRRSIEFLYYVPIKEYSSVFGSRDRVNAGGKRLPADYPETLPSWQGFIRKHGSQSA